ncbi:hypothetical protein ABGW23_11595, partial [Leuconostoc mesenteroides]
DRSLAMGHRITSVLSALNIARSTYYQWKNWHPSQQETRRNALKTAIKAVYNTQHQSRDLWLPTHRRIFTVHFEH